MPSYKERRKDCKFYVEEALKKLQWKTNDQLPESFAKKECAVIYTGVKTGLETQQSYRPVIYIKIIFDLDDNNDMLILNDELTAYITKYVEDSNCPYCGSFYFEDSDFIPTGGRSFRAELIARFEHEKDWVSEF